ncbi:MAG TPA: D-alanyl-D-alanine carboxypeptidase family protein [Clostridiales bacterium]|nr:D-alanyl-D-alanine carboxypeptidase family protein [Clostridiales bacterium]
MKKNVPLPFFVALFLLLCFSGNVKAAVFQDVSAGSWYAPAVNHCYEKGYMEGVTAATFAPDVAMSRAMLMTVLYRGAGSPAVSAKNPFFDVAAATWYTDAVLWGVEKGIAAGYEDGSFRPGSDVSRQELMVFLYRFLSVQGKVTNENGEAALYHSFDDVTNVGSWAVKAGVFCTSWGLINGSDGYLLPLDSSTRAQIAMVLLRLDNYLAGDTHQITATAGDHGKISPAGTATLVDGASVTYRFLPDSGYMVNEVKVDGVSLGYAVRKSVAINGANHTVSVTFKKKSGNPNSGYAQLVNRSYPIVNAASYVPNDLTAVSYVYPGKAPQSMRSAAASAMNRMIADFKKAYPGYSLYTQSGYRSYATQQTLYQNQISKQGGNIYKAGTISAVPGTSEHQLGLAMDVTTDGTLLQSFGSTVQGKWIAAHCSEYGYILRYPTNQQQITGIIYEPWHFRYVGVEVAAEMKQLNVATLEEYYGLYLNSADLNPYLPYLK